MLDRTIEIGNYKVRMVYDENNGIYKCIYNRRILCCGDTANEAIETAEMILNKMSGE